MAKDSKIKRNTGRWGRKHRANAYRDRRGKDIKHRGAASRARGAARGDGRAGEFGVPLDYGTPGRKR